MEALRQGIGRVEGQERCWKLLRQGQPSLHPHLRFQEGNRSLGDAPTGSYSEFSGPNQPQKTGDVSAIVFDDNRITPAKLYVGMYVMNGRNEYAKSERWHNSKDGVKDHSHFADLF